MASKQQVLRVDEEVKTPILEDTKTNIIRYFRKY